MRRSVKSRVIVTILGIAVLLSACRESSAAATAAELADHRPSAPPAQAPKDSEYAALVERIRNNNTEISGFQFAMHNEATTRPALTDAATAQPDRIADVSLVQEIWPNYLRNQQLEQSEYYSLTEVALDAPLDVVVHNVIEQEYEGAKYVIEVLTWQAAPGLYMPATLYRPDGNGTGNYPVVITPPGCKEGVATHNEATSVQRRMANFALGGMISFTTEGLCSNGLTGKNLENRYQYEYLSMISGARIGGSSLEIAIWIRALDYLASRDDTDMRRVGATGYSNGASITTRLATMTDRIHAVAIVATKLGYLTNTDEDYFNAARDITVDTKPPRFYYGGHWQSPFSSPSSQVDVIAKMQDTLLEFWTRQQLEVASRLGAPRAVYILLGAQDELYSESGARRLIQEMRTPWNDLDAPVVPRLDIVSGAHTFDAPRRGMVRNWLIDALSAEPLLPPPSGDEYATEVLPKDDLQVAPQSHQSVSLHAIYVSAAEEFIEARRAEYRLVDQSKDEARAHIRSLLGIEKLSQGGPERPILVDDTRLDLGGNETQFRYWLIPIAQNLVTGMILLAPPSPQAPSSIELHISTDDGILLQEHLFATLSDGKALAVLLAPGFGEAASSQMTTGNLARLYMGGPTLLGLGEVAVRNAVGLLDGLWPGTGIDTRARGIDAANIAYFAFALDPRLGSLTVEEGLRSFRTILTSPEVPVPPPTLLVPGLIADVGVPELRWLSSPRPFNVLSEADLGELEPVQ